MEVALLRQAFLRESETHSVLPDRRAKRRELSPGHVSTDGTRPLTIGLQPISNIIHHQDREVALGVATVAGVQDVPREVAKLASQTVGNIGLYFVCYRLSRCGWNVMPTSRNAKGIDVLAYSQSGKAVVTIQVKALSARTPVPLGGSLSGFIADFVVVCRNVRADDPESFVLTSSEVVARAHHGIKAGVSSYWLQPKAYEGEAFRERWDKIGDGF